MKNKVQLITYVDRLGGGGIAALQALLRGPLRGVFGAAHLLPFYTPVDGADAGFDPSDHLRVDARLGGWDDIRSLAVDLDVMADVIVNHISDQSAQFQDFRRLGFTSVHRDLFLTRESMFPAGITAAELARIYRPRPGEPFIDVTFDNGGRATLWATFTRHQIDIDVRHPQGRAYLQQILRTLATGGVSMVRLDAVGYAIKQPGTSCFMLPETFDFIAWMAAEARALGIETLVEVHAYYERQLEIARHVDRVYDFALPPLLLHAFARGTAEYLRRWIGIRPNNSVTVLDTHDGIGIVDIGPDSAGHPGLVPNEHIAALVEQIHAASAGQSRLATGVAASNLDVYQVNCTYFDALGRDERRYLLTRAIQFFVPGVPQVYYVGLFAGHNDMDLLARTGVGRDINRHHYTAAELREQLARPVVRDLLALIRFRNEHPAFSGTFELLDSGSTTLAMRWTSGIELAELRVDLSSAAFELRYTDGPQVRQWQFSSGPAQAAGPR